MTEFNNVIPDKEIIIDDSITCPKCEKSDQLKISKFSFNIANNDFNEKIEIGCVDCWYIFEVDKVKVTQEEYTEVHKRLRFSKDE